MPRDDRFVYTGVAASELEEQQMANPPPVMVIGGSVTPTQAEIMHQCALANGLPDIHGFYGYDFEQREFIKLPQSMVKLPPRVLDSEERRETEELDEDTELEDADLDRALREGFEE